MRRSIGYQLFSRGIIILLFILSIAIAGGICIKLLKRTSNKVFTEYIELDVMQEMKMAFINVIVSLNMHTLNKNTNSRAGFEQSIKNCTLKLKECKDVLTHRHDRNQLDRIQIGISNLDSLKNVLITGKSSQFEVDNIHNQIIQIVNDGVQASELILGETKIEIGEFIRLNNTAVKHSTITMILLGFVMLFITTTGGFLFIKKLTNPIFKLLASTQKVGEGDFATLVKIESNNEFMKLAESFNSMTQKLEKTTVSKNYYDGILKNMIESLIVTDLEGIPYQILNV